MSLRILIVEDEEAMCQSLVRFFNMRKYQAFGTGNGLVAMEIAEKEHPHVVICDLQLVGSPITGIEVMKRIYEKYNDTKLIVLTGFSGDTDIRRMCMEYKPIRFYAKPAPLVEMLSFMAEFAKEIKD